MVKTATNLRKSGIDVMGDILWGTHVVATAAFKSTLFERPRFATCDTAATYMLQASFAKELPSLWTYQ
jgi:hypothetical protein